MDDIVKNFNDVAIQMLGELRKIIPHSVILNNTDLLKSFVKNSSKKTVLIDYFVVYVLKYKDEIDEENEDFFLKHDFEDISSSTKDTNSIVKIINEIKKMWRSITDKDDETSRQNKKNIFGYFKVLSFYAEKYFLEIDKEE